MTTLTIDHDRLTVACPECDQAAVYARQRDAEAADGLFRCNNCEATFDEAIVREFQKRAGGTAKYSDLDPEDVGL